MKAEYAEDELIPLSALQHLVFCERQFALIHVEREWAENILTVAGRHFHEAVDRGGSHAHHELRVARGLPVRSLRLGLIGRTDAVEFHRSEHGAELSRWGGTWQPMPVEFKRGRPKRHRADEIQLCAQALCLEEMLSTPVPRGALFYGKSRRRLEVDFDEELRGAVESTALRAHELMEQRLTPAARQEPKCRSCSLFGVCRPDALGRSAQGFLRRALLHAQAMCDGQEVDA